MPERDQTRINERIGVREVRLVDEDGKQIGVIETKQALAMAQERDLDLVEVAPDSRPPVARLLDYSKYKYELEQKAKAARKHQQQINVREIKLRPKIADHDYMTKKGHVERFLKGGDKVKVTIMFRGREQAHPERGRALLARLFEDLEGLGVVEQNPLQEGRNMHMLVAPSKEALRDQKAKTGEQPAVPDPDAAPVAEADVSADAEAPAEAEAPIEAEAQTEADEVPAETETTAEADGQEPSETEEPSEAGVSPEQKAEAATS
ncbi:MAG: translation initiation factor IF-3 [Solirubrobacterales bacterium]